MAPPTTQPLLKSFFTVPSFVILLLTLTIFFSPCLSSPNKISYADYCSSIIPQSPASVLSPDTTNYIHFNSYFSGGNKILSPETDSDTSSSSSSSPGYFSFYTNTFYRTKIPELIQIDGSINLQTSHPFFITSSSRTRRRRFRSTGKFVKLDLSGYWSQSTGMICMVGSGSAGSNPGTTTLKLSAVFKLNYPFIQNISTSLFSGTVESLDASDSPNHFDPISLFGYAQNKYKYTQTTHARDTCSHIYVPKKMLVLDASSFCDYLKKNLLWRFQLEYGSDCSTRNCGPFTSKESLGFIPTFLSFNRFQCTEDGKVHMYIEFSNSSMYQYNNPFPEKSLAAEGFWNSEKNRLCLVGCPILKTKDYSIGDCTIGLSLWFPAFFTIRDRFSTLGQIWTTKHKTDPGYFSSIMFRSTESTIGILPGLEYEYTEFDSVRRYCKNNQDTNFTNDRYPDGKSIEDLRFGITVKNVQGNTMRGSANPLSIGTTFYGNSFYRSTREIASDITLLETDHSGSHWNVSYTIMYWSSNSSLKENVVTDISAEGIYNAGSGTLCMVGCRILSSSGFSETRKTKDSMDCEILINFQLSPLNLVNGDKLNGDISSTRHLNGTIKSTRKKSDTLYFHPLEVSSYNMYNTEAIEAVSRMDIEIALVLFSLTISCIFIGFQLFHVKKHQDVLPSISITMLVILTLGHMIPLVLNFEDLFFNDRNKQNVFLWSGQWLEVNEVIVRVMTMVAILLQFRLLHSTWTAKSSDEHKKRLWIYERKALKFCLPLYFAGALIAWLVHTRSYEHNNSVWEDLTSYGGLILDGFLLPQIILNIICYSKDKALIPVFYIGTTAVRTLPHLYHAYRARYYVPYFSSSYIYANPVGDLFSSAWDIIIPIGGVLFTVLLFLQQRFGGSCFLPRRFRKPNGGYERVSVISL